MPTPDDSQFKSCEDAELAFPGFEAYQEIACEILAIEDCESVIVPGDGTLIVETTVAIETIEEHSG